MTTTPLSAFRSYRELPRSVHVLFFARMVNSAGAFVIPFLALFLTQRVGMTPAAAGRFMLLLAVAHVPGSLIGGKLADRIGRKRVLIFGQALAGALLIPGVFLGTSMLVAVGVVVAQFFSALAQPSSQAMVTDLTDPASRPAAFSLLYLGYNIGLAVGPMLAGYLFSHATWALFLGDAVTTFIAVALVAVYVPDTIPDQAGIAAAGDNRAAERAVEGGAVRALLARPLLIFFACGVAVLAFIYAQQGFSLPLQMKAVFGGEGPLLFGSLMTVNAIVVIFLTGLVVSLTARFSPAFNLVLASATYAIGFGMIFFIRSMPLFVISTFAWTLGEILVTTNMNVYVANHTPVTHRGRFNALVPLITGGGQAISPAVAGAWIHWFGLAAIWPVLALLAVIAAAGLSAIILVERRAAKADSKS